MKIKTTFMKSSEKYFKFNIVSQFGSVILAGQWCAGSIPMLIATTKQIMEDKQHLLASRFWLK